MENEKKDEINACIEKVESVEEFLKDWYSVNDLFEVAANAASVLLEQQNLSTMADSDLAWLRKLIDQHVMLANLMKKFEKGGEV